MSVRRICRQAYVSEPFKPPSKKHSVYKITYNVVCFDGTEIEHIEPPITVLKRYRQLKALSDILSKYHTALQRFDAFPEMVKAKFKNRFEENTLRERQESAQAMLNFICRKSYLYEHEAFKEFLSKSIHLDDESDDGDHSQ